MVLNAYHGLQFPFRELCCIPELLCRISCAKCKVGRDFRITLSSLKVDCHSDKDPEFSTAKKYLMTSIHLWVRLVINTLHYSLPSDGALPDSGIGNRINLVLGKTHF